MERFCILATAKQIKQGIFYILKSTLRQNTGVVNFPRLQDSLVSLFRKNTERTATPFPIYLTFNF